MPNLPPIVCGVADHGVLLGGSLKRMGVEVDYLGLHGEKGRHGSSRLVVWNGSASGLEDVVRQLGSEVLWVQYSGYGFSNKGVPIKLVRALETLRKRNVGLKVAICMHETHASNASLGWRTPLLQPLQIFAARRIAHTGNILFATVENNLNRCVREYGVCSNLASLLPISSNIPRTEVSESDRDEFRKQLHLADDARVAVIFGTWSTQLRTLNVFMAELIASLRTGRIAHVLAVGGDTGACRKDAVVKHGRELGAHLTIHGPTPGKEIGRIIACCDIGLVPTPLEYLRKSGVVAAFSAAGLEMWQKGAGTEVVVLREIEPFPTWDEIAGFALKRIKTLVDDRELDCTRQ